MTDGTANCELLRWEWVREGEEGVRRGSAMSAARL